MLFGKELFFFGELVFWKWEVIGLSGKAKLIEKVVLVAVL